MQRKIKNVVKNYTASEIKVREATSNDPWGPSTILMSEISTLTFDPLACAEMMNIIWKRLNDHGKNWRHVYKSLVLLDFLLRTGSERIVKQCRENIIFIQTLRDFQYVENGLDCGLNVREAAKKLYDLLKDDDRLKNERHKTNKSKSKYSDFRNFQSSAGDLSTNGNGYGLSHTSYPERKYRPFTTDEMERELHMTVNTPISNQTISGGSQARSSSSARPTIKDPEMESIRPCNQNEEEIQLQLALAMSKEQHEEDMKKVKSEQIKLQMAIEESRKTAEKEKLWNHPLNYVEVMPKKPASSSSQLLSQAIADPWLTTTTSLDPSLDPWKSEISNGKPRVSKNSRDVDDLFATTADPFYTSMDRPQQQINNNNNSSSNISNDIFNNYSSSNTTTATRAKYPWEMDSKPVKANQVVDEFSEILHRPTVTSNSTQQNNFNNNASNDFLNNNNPSAKSNVNNMHTNVSNDWSSNDIFANKDNQFAAGANFENKNDSIEDLLNLHLTTTAATEEHLKNKNIKKVTPEEFLGPNAKLVDFDELIAKPNPAKTINPFAIMIAKGPVQNPFAAKAQEERSKRVPLNQLQSSSNLTDQSASAFHFDNSTYSSQSHDPNLNSYSTPTLALLYNPSSSTQNQTFNPFL